MPAERISSNQTVVHHDSWSEDHPVEEKPKENEQTEVAEQIEVDGRNEKEHDTESEGYPDPTKSELDRERQIDRIEAQIQAAARAVIASIEHDEYHGEDSLLSMRTDESYDNNSQLTYGDGTELTYDGTEGTYEKEDDHHDQDVEGDSSSHHDDGDIDDDVFSHSDRSGRSSLNSCHELHSSDEVQSKELTSPSVGEEAAESISRIPSATLYTPQDSSQVTPSRVLSRPPFRTPSSVRAIQMSSPTPSIFSSPRSTKRHLPTVSRIGTPNLHYSSPTKKTPTRFKVKKEYPLVLLHVTVLPLSWTYSHMMSSPELPPALHSVKDSWRLLQDKLGDTVLERGILLPHPQDSYEVLEERLLEALELPVRPRARILKCGHYLGPETPTSSEEDDRDQYFQRDERKWCDICGRDVRIEGIMDDQKRQRFRIKIYASNGLMRAGAWAAAWREMERVDVEIEPFVESGLAVELEHMVASEAHLPQAEDGDGFEDEEDIIEHVHEHGQEQAIKTGAPDEDAVRRRLMEEERIREVYGADTPFTPNHPEQPRKSKRHSSSSLGHEDSLLDLLIAAFKVAVRDRKNVAICLLSVLVLLLALRPGSIATSHSLTSQTVPEMFSDVEEHAREKAAQTVVESPTNIPELNSLETHVSSAVEVGAVKPQIVATPTPILSLPDSLVDDRKAAALPTSISEPVNEDVPFLEQAGEKEENIPIEFKEKKRSGILQRQ